MLTSLVMTRCLAEIRAFFPDNERMHYMLIKSRGLQLPWIVSVDLEVVQEDVLSPSEALQSLSLCCP